LPTEELKVRPDEVDILRRCHANAILMQPTLAAVALHAFLFRSTVGCTNTAWKRSAIVLTLPVHYN